MSNAREARCIASGSAVQKNPPPLMVRTTSLHTINNEMKPKQTFMEYKTENRKLEPQSTPAASRNEKRRKSKVIVQGDESTATLGQVSNDFDVDVQEYSFPLKIFDGTKKAITDVSEQSNSYFWLRRIKEIFLQMGTSDGSFVEFDMTLAQTDMLTSCNVYLRNDLNKLKKKERNRNGPSSNDSDERGLIQKIAESVKQMRNTEVLLADEKASVNTIASLNTSTDQLLSNIQSLKQKIRYIKECLKEDANSKDKLDCIRKALCALPKEEKSQIKTQQECSMKKLYAEVLKLSYKRHDLRTPAQKAELKPEKKGNEEPNFGNAIWWYSCNEASIYYQINSVLKTENFELLMAYRYYISDLCKMIEYIYKNEQSQTNKTKTFYRAASIDQKYLEQMRKSLEEKNKGQVISMGGFISTTSKPKVAKQYARTQSLSDKNVRVLFKISVVSDKPCTAHAYIGNLSFHPEEEETLFSMGSTFSVNKVCDPGMCDCDKEETEAESTEKANAPKEEVNYYTIHTTACDVDQALLDDIRAKIQECSASQLAVLLARYILELGESRAARKYLTALCSESGRILKDDPALASIYNCLGMTFSRQNLYADAIEYDKKALDCQARLEYSNNNALAEIHNNIGLSLIDLKLMDEAQATLEEAERIQLREPSTTRAHLASIYANIAHVHYTKKDSEYNRNQSETYFEKAIVIYQKPTSKISHDAIERALLKAECYTNYGHLLSLKNERDAEKRYKEALNIYKSVLPDSDPKLLRAHMNIMMEHAYHDNFKEVIALYKNSDVEHLIEKQGENLFTLEKVVTQEDLIILFQTIGVCYINEEEYFEAISAWTRAYELEWKSKLVKLLVPLKHHMSSLPAKLIDIAYKKARTYFMSDQVQMAKNDEDRPQTGRTVRPSINFSCGFMSFKCHSYEDAIEYFKKDVNENEKICAYLLCAEMFESMKDFDNAGKAYESALNKIKLEDEQAVWIKILVAKIECTGWSISHATEVKIKYLNKGSRK